MRLSNNVEFYHKILSGIVLFFCFFLIVELNVMRYEHLSRTKPLKMIEKNKPLTPIASVRFNDAKDHTKLLFLFDSSEGRYYLSALSFLKPDNNVVLIDCTEGRVFVLNAFLKKFNVREEKCEISEDKLEKLVQENNNVVIINLKENEKTHDVAMRVAKRMALRPKAQITEINNDY